MAEETSVPNLREYLKSYGEQRAHLAGSRAKLDRAKTHLKTLERELRLFREKGAYSVFGDRHPDTGTYFVAITPPRKVPPKLAAITGDVLSNLRPTLDYLVFALAKLDSGEPQEGTQFPITSSPKLFEREVKRGRLRGLTDEHVAAIERLQPYDGGDDERTDLVWLAWLRDLSNPDKHRELSVLISNVKGDFEVTEKPRRVRRVKQGGARPKPTPATLREILRKVEAEERPKPKTEKPRLTFNAPKGHPLHGSDMYVHVGLRFDVAFESPRLPVIPALKVFHSQTAKLLDTFEPEFKR